MLPPLLLTRPLHQLAPILALMFCAKSMHAINLLIHDLNRDVGMTHQALAQQICAVPHVARSDINVDVLIRELLPRDGGVMVGPISSPHVVLHNVISISSFGEIAL